jgi:hypothetical protein
MRTVSREGVTPFPSCIFVLFRGSFLGTLFFVDTGLFEEYKSLAPMQA